VALLAQRPVRVPAPCPAAPAETNAPASPPTPWPLLTSRFESLRSRALRRADSASTADSSSPWLQTPDSHAAQQTESHSDPGDTSAPAPCPEDPHGLPCPIPGSATETRARLRESPAARAESPHRS